MADKKIVDLTAIVTQSGTDLYETSLNGSGSRKETRTQMASYIQSNITNKTNEIYVSNKQLGTGTGTQVNPYATLGEALAVAVTGSVIILDVGSYTASNFAMKPISILSYSPMLTNLTVAAITLDNASWQAATNPNITIKGVKLSGSVVLTASVIKSSSSVIIDNVQATLFSAANMGAVTLSNRCVIPTVEGTECDLSIDSCFMSTSVYYAWAAANRTVILNNCTTPTIDTFCGGNTLTLVTTNMSGLNDVNTDAPYGSLQVKTDAVSYPTNGYTQGLGDSILEPIFLDNIAKGISTYRGFGLGWDTSQAWGTFFGSTGGVDPTFFHGRGASGAFPASGIANFFIGTYYNQNDKNYCFAAADGNSSAIPTAHQQWIASYLNGYTFGGVPRANFSIKAGTTGSIVYSAVGEIADGTMNNNEINTMIEVNDVIVHKTKNATGGINRTVLGMQVEPIVHTVTGDTLLINRRHNININTANQCAFGAFLKRGDQCQVVILGTGKTRIGTSGSQSVKFLGVDVGSSNYICSQTQYSSLLVEWTENDTIEVKSMSGTWFSENSGGTLLATFNMLGDSPIINGGMTLNGNLVLTGSIATATSMATSIIRGSSVVADGSLSNIDINPYVSTDTFILKYKNSSGTARNLTFPAGGGTIPEDASLIHTSGDESASGIKTWTGLARFTAPLTCNVRVLEANLISSDKTSASFTISENDLIGGILLCTPTAPQTAQLPTATDLNSALALLWGGINPPQFAVLEFTVENAATTGGATTTLTTNTGWTIVTQTGVPVVTTGSCKRYKAVKTSPQFSTAAYALFGGG